MPLPKQQVEQSVTESEQYVINQIRYWVWSGFYLEVDIEDRLEDIIEADCDRQMLLDFIKAEQARKLEAQRDWPEVTDCDKLNRVFASLDKSGICAQANAGYTMSDGHEDIGQVVGNSPPDTYHGFCFYHGQDVERAIDGQGIMLAFGDLRDDPVRGEKVGQRIAGLLRETGFAVEWDGTLKTRIKLPGLQWRHRGLLGVGRQKRQPRELEFIVFYEDYFTAGFGGKRPEEETYFTIPEICSSIDKILRRHKNFFGIVDAAGETVQFYANANGSVRMEHVVLSRQGSIGKDGALEEALALVKQAGPDLTTLEIPGAEFSPW